MIPWKDRLEIKVLVPAVILPLLGALTISAGVLLLLRSSLVDVARERSETTAEIITRNLEEVMINGRADLTAKMVEELRRMSGVERLDVISGTGGRAFAPDSPVTEEEAMARLRRTGEPFSLRQEDALVFYRPLLNGPRCAGCHEQGHRLLGAAKVTVSLQGVFAIGSRLIRSAFGWSLLGVALMGGLVWLIIRRLVVTPVKEIRGATRALAAGDLTVEVPVDSRDEIGELWCSLRESIQTLGGVVGRINTVAGRVAAASDQIEKESAEVVGATGTEAQSFGSIAAAMEEFNASIGEITNGVGELARVAQQATAASQELAASTAEVAASTEELVQAAETTSATTGDMSHTIRELNWGATHLSEVSRQTLQGVQSMEEFIGLVEESARESARSSERVRSEAEELGVRSVERTMTGMEEIHQAVSRASEFVTSLGGRSKQIGEVVDIIDDVNDQTSLLALNAAILAAQAGEHGKGFQVVAAEIRKLANRTARSTVEISALIGNVRAEVSGAVEAMKEGLRKIEGGVGSAREAGGALEKIVASAGASMEKTAAIRDSTGEQSTNLAAIREAMERLDQMTSFLAQGTTEQQREADKINRSAEQVHQAVTHIRAASHEQVTASGQIAEAVEQVSDGTKQMSRALQDEKEGSGHIMHALSQVVDLPGRTRALALGINRGLRGILSDTSLLRAEAERFTVPEAAGTLSLGVVPLEAPAKMHRRFSPLAGYLGDALGKTVSLKVALDFAEAVADLGAGRTRIAFLTPSTYVKARRLWGVRLLAVALRGGHPFHHAVVVAREGSGITRLEDLKGRSFAFGDVDSTSSHIVPRAMLQQHGVSMDDLCAHDHLGRHDDVARAVLKGEYDAGGLMESVALQEREHGLVIVEKSPPIPEFNICAAADLESDEFERLQRALIGLSNGSMEGKEILAALYQDYDGFAVAKDADYDGIRRMMEELQLIDTTSSPVGDAEGPARDRPAATTPREKMST